MNAQTAFSIIDSGLRNERENKIFHRVEIQRKICDKGKNFRAEKRDEPFVTRAEIEKSIGRLQKAFRIFEPFFVVSFQNFFVRFAAQNKGEFPREIIAVLNSRVHSLRSGGRVNMRRISGKKTSAFRKFIDAARVNFVNRKPVDIVDVQIEFGVLDNLLFDFLVKNFAFAPRIVFGKCADNAEMIFAAGHRKKCEQIIFHQKNVERIVRKFPFDLHVGDIKKAFKSAAFKRHSERMPHDAFRAVTADEKFCFDLIRFAVYIFYICRYAAFVLGKIFEFRFPQNIFSIRFDKIVKNFFVLALFDKKQKRIRTHSFADIRQINFAAHAARFDEPRTFGNRAL